MFSLVEMAFFLKITVLPEKDKTILAYVVWSIKFYYIIVMLAFESYKAIVLLPDPKSPNRRVFRQRLELLRITVLC